MAWNPANKQDIQQGFIKFLSPPIGEEYQVVKGVGEYHVCREEYNMGKMVKGKKQYHLPYDIKAAGKNIKRGKGDRSFGEENQD